MEEFCATARLQAAALLLVLLACYGYFLPKSIGDDWVSSSRAALTFALVDRGKINIDAYHDRTGDKAYFEGHYYTVGSIGPSLLAVPCYALFAALSEVSLVQRVLWRYNPERPRRGAYETAALAVITFWIVSVPSACLAVLLYGAAVRLTGCRSSAFVVTLIFGLATPAFPYSRAFYQHQVAAFCAIAGGVLLWRSVQRSRSAWRLWLSGFLFGLALISEYSSIFIILPIMAALFPRLASPAVWLPLGTGMAVPISVAAAYNMAAFGTVLPVSYRYHVTHSVHQHGIMGLGLPSPARLYGLTFGSFRGLFFLSPVLLAGCGGLVLMWREPAFRRLAAICTTIVVSFFLYNASYAFWWGGSALGPRFLVPALPFLSLPLVFAWQRWWNAVAGRVVLSLLVGVSAFNVWALSITGAYYPPNTLNNPLWEHAVAALLRADISPNYGMWVGLTGFASLLPLAAWVAAVLSALRLLTHGNPIQCARTR